MLSRQYNITLKQYIMSVYIYYNQVHDYDMHNKRKESHSPAMVKGNMLILAYPL